MPSVHIRIYIEREKNFRNNFSPLYHRGRITRREEKGWGGKRTKLNSFSRNSRLAQNGTIFSLRFTFIRRNGRELDDTEFSMGGEREEGWAHTFRPCARGTLSLLAVEIALTAAPGVERWGGGSELHNLHTHA